MYKRQAVCWYAGRQLESGRAADAKDLFAWVERGWPGQFGAQERANEAERVIIDGLLAIGTQDALSQAAQRAGALEDGAREEQANLALARLAIDSGDHAAAESLLRAMPTNEEAQALLLELVYSIAAAVSYTHLDVYKRQCRSWSGPAPVRRLRSPGWPARRSAMRITLNARSRRCPCG